MSDVIIENINDEKLINEKTPVIFQAVFSTAKFMAATDVLQWNEKALAYDLYEIKMSTTEEGGAVEASEKERKIDKKKEDQYENDLAFTPPYRGIFL